MYFNAIPQDSTLIFIYVSLHQNCDKIISFSSQKHPLTIDVIRGCNVIKICGCKSTKLVNPEVASIAATISASIDADICLVVVIGVAFIGHIAGVRRSIICQHIGIIGMPV